jgi:hypothetical protein
MKKGNEETSVDRQKNETQHRDKEQTVPFIILRKNGLRPPSSSTVSETNLLPHG